MVFKKILLLIFLTSLVINMSSASEIENYNAMCDLIQDVMKFDLKSQARVNYINKHFDARVGSKDVKEAYDLIFQVNSNQRYQVFKQSIESATNKTWSCSALKDFFK